MTSNWLDLEPVRDGITERPLLLGKEATGVRVFDHVTFTVYDAMVHLGAPHDVVARHVHNEVVLATYEAARRPT